MEFKKIIKSTKLYQYYNHYRWREHKVSCGKQNPDKTFYIIRRHAQKAGLFSFILTNLGSIKYALDNGYIPIIDMQSSINPMLMPKEVNKVNAWELFFEQPCGFSLADVSDAQNVILGSINTPDAFPDYPILDNAESVIEWQKLMHRYVSLKPEIIKDSQEYINNNFNNKRVLGILCRGTDYVELKPHDHPIQPNIGDVITDAKNLISKHDLQYIYLATEDIEIWNRFNSEFPGKVISFQQNHFSLSSNENINDYANKMVSPYRRNREYLTSIYILSKCNILLAGATSGSIGALLMSDSYEYYHIYQLGLYS